MCHVHHVPDCMGSQMHQAQGWACCAHGLLIWPQFKLLIPQSFSQRLFVTALLLLCLALGQGQGGRCLTSCTTANCFIGGRHVQLGSGCGVQDSGTEVQRLGLTPIARSAPLLGAWGVGSRMQACTVFTVCRLGTGLASNQAGSGSDLAMPCLVKSHTLLVQGCGSSCCHLQPPQASGNTHK